MHPGPTHDQEDNEDKSHIIFTLVAIALILYIFGNGLFGIWQGYLKAKAYITLDQSLEHHIQAAAQAGTITIAKAEIKTAVDLMHDPLIQPNSSGDRPSDLALRDRHQKLLKTQQSLNKVNSTSSLLDQEKAIRQIRQTFGENENRFPLEVDATTQEKVNKGTMNVVALVCILSGYGAYELLKWLQGRYFY